MEFEDVDYKKIPLLSSCTIDQGNVTGSTDRTSTAVKAPPNDITSSVPPSVLHANYQLQPLVVPQPVNKGAESDRVVMVQPGRVYMTQQKKWYNLDDYEHKLWLLFICSCFACCFCCPLAIVACFLTGWAYDRAAHHKDPRTVMTSAATAIVLSFVLGIISGVIYITRRHDM